MPGKSEEVRVLQWRCLEAVTEWKTGGSQWSSWLITVTLEVGSGNGGLLHVLSCYAPTYAASREERTGSLRAAVKDEHGNVCLGLKEETLC